MYLMSSTRCGISAKQLERELGVTYKTAWRMAKLIRKEAMQQEDGMFAGTVEADETYVGGRRRGTPRGRPGPNSHKTAVFGMVERKGHVMATTVPNVRKATLMPHIIKRVMPRAIIFTDELKSYNGLPRAGYFHRRVNHSAQIYVSGNVHTNTIEGFWALVKGGIKGVYHSVSPDYLQNYLDEYTFRYNHRKDEKPMFLTFLHRMFVPRQA